MKSTRVLSVLLLVLLLGMLSPPGTPSIAQSVVTVSIDDLQFDAFPTIKIPVSVRNENGVPIVGLGPEDFEIIEDGGASFVPDEVQARTNPDATISVVMTIDVSGSMEGAPVKEAMRAANALIDEMSVQDRGAVIAFADEVDIEPTHLEEGKEIGFTTDKNALRNVVNFLDTKLGWDTPLYDAVYKSVKMVAQEPVGKRAVIVMTDGRDERDNADGIPVKDEGSLSTADDPINEANRHNIPIYSVGLVGQGDRIDAKYLQRLAERTGGEYQEAPQPEELTPIFQGLVDDLKEQYVLTYDTSLAEDDREHSILVRVELPQGQAFNETKFRFQPEASGQSDPLQETATAESTSEPADGTPTAMAQTDPTPGPGATSALAPSPTAGGIGGILDDVQGTVEDDPVLAIVIGAGVLLLIALVIALVIVLLRGRGADQVYYDEQWEDAYAPLPSEPVGTTGVGGAPAQTAPGWEGGEKTEVAPQDWPQAADAAPIAPPPKVGPGAAGGIPPADETRVIQRAPKHLAMLVDKAHPDQKHDLVGTVNIGRARDNEITVDHPTVSRHHAWIRADGEQFMVFDVGSANGTFVNDEQVKDPRLLENGDVIRFGEATFVFTKVF